MNKIKYFLVNANSVLGIVWEDETYGRTITFTGKIDLDYPVSVYDKDSNVIIEDMNLINFFASMLPL